MPSHCSVPGCTANYYKGRPKVSMFKFPKDELLQKRWIVAIRRKDFSVSKYSTVCERHFKKSDFETEISAYDPKTGKTLTAPLSVKRLKKGVIPSLAIPKYSEVSEPSREDPEEKRMQVEKKQLNLAVQQNLKSSCETKLEDSANAKDNSKSPVSRLTEGAAEGNKQERVVKRKKKNAKESVSNKKVNGMCNSDSMEECHSTDNQVVSQNRNLTASTNGLSSSEFSFQETDTNMEQQKHHHNQTSSSEMSECCKNYQVQIKEETPWEEEYGWKSNTKDKLIENNAVKIVSVESSSSSGTTNKMDIKETCSEGCDTTFYKKPLKVDSRDETFGRLVACEMSDLRGNPELYLRTQQSILKLLVEAHFEQMSSV